MRIVALPQTWVNFLDGNSPEAARALLEADLNSRALWCQRFLETSLDPDEIEYLTTAGENFQAALKQLSSPSLELHQHLAEAVLASDAFEFKRLQSPYSEIPEFQEFYRACGSYLAQKISAKQMADRLQRFISFYRTLQAELKQRRLRKISLDRYQEGLTHIENALGLCLQALSEHDFSKMQSAMEQLQAGSKPYHRLQSHMRTQDRNLRKSLPDSPIPIVGGLLVKAANDLEHCSASEWRTIVTGLKRECFPKLCSIWPNFAEQIYLAPALRAQLLAPIEQSLPLLGDAIDLLVDPPSSPQQSLQLFRTTLAQLTSEFAQIHQLRPVLADYDKTENYPIVRLLIAALEGRIPLLMLQKTSELLGGRDDLSDVLPSLSAYLDSKNRDHLYTALDRLIQISPKNPPRPAPKGGKTTKFPGWWGHPGSQIGVPSGRSQSRPSESNSQEHNQAPPQAPAKATHWTCPACEHSNSIHFGQCGHCLRPRNQNSNSLFR